MLTLPLDPTDDRAKPIFTDVVSCAHWLNQLQLTNLQRAHGQLLTQITEFNSYPMRGLERLNTLELLRETVEHIQADLAKKLIDKPLPLNDLELTVFVSIKKLWQTMVASYQRVLQSYIAGDKQLANYGALLCQRCLLYSGMEIFEHLRTGYEFDNMLWHQLHELYTYAEHQKFHLTAVTDPICPQATQISCTSSYVKTLLACYANPAELTRWQLQKMDLWLDQWSSSVTLAHNYRLSKGDSQPLASDLASAEGLQRIEGLPQIDSLRYLAMVPLSKLLRVKIILLQQGHTPQQEGLGDHADSEACLELLRTLLQLWCEKEPDRLSRRRPMARLTEVCYQLEEIYAHASGKPFTQQTRSSQTRNARQALEILGRERLNAHHEEQAANGYPLENWQIENESAMGARLTRGETTGGRLSRNQLIAVRPSDAKSFLLGSTAWVMVNRQGKLQIGVKYMPSLPEAISISGAGINRVSTEPSAAALLLPAQLSLKTPASLILPPGWFQPKRVIEVLQIDGEIVLAQLGFSVERGMNYERVSFTILKS
jgi:cyclic-di-GMP-binding protein